MNQPTVNQLALNRNLRTPSSFYRSGSVHVIWKIALALTVGLVSLDSLRAQDPPEAVRLASEAGTLQNQQQFDLAAELWDDYLKDYPTASMAAKAEHYSGVCHMKSGNLEQGIARFAAVIEKGKADPTFPLLEDALLNIGWSEFTLAGQRPAEAATRYAAAVTWFAQLTEQFPEGRYRDQAVYFTAEARYLSGDAAGALPIYRRMETEFTESALLPNSIYALAVALDELNQRTEALAAYDRFLEKFPEHELAGDVAMRRAESTLRTALETETTTGDAAALWQAPLEAFKTLAAKPDFDQADRAMYQQAFCEAKLGRLQVAAELYAELLTRFPTSAIGPEARVSAARSWFSTKEYAKGAEIVAPLLTAVGPKTGEAAHWWAKHKLESGGADEVFTELGRLSESLASDPFAAQVAMDRADAAYRGSTHRGEARDLYAAVAEKFSSSPVAPQALYNAAFEDFTAGKTDPALAAIATFVERYPQDPFLADMRALEGECRISRGEMQAAIETYTALIASASDHPDRERWPLRLALAQYGAKKYAEAITGLSAVTAWSRPEWSAEADYLVGASKFHQGDAAGAVTSLTRAIDPANGWSQTDAALVVLARAQAKLEQRAEARATLLSLIERFPTSAQVTEAEFRLGEIAEALGDNAEAKTRYTTVAAQSTHPFAPFAIVAAAWLDYDAKSWDLAEQGFRKIIASHPQHSVAGEAALGLGMSLRQLSRFDEGITTLSAALAKETDAARKNEIRFELALSQIGAKKYEEADKELLQLMTEAPTWSRMDQALYQYAWAAKYRSDTAAATERFGKLAEAYPESPLAAEGRFHQGEAEYEAQRYPAAQAYYEQALAGKPTTNIADNARYKLGWSRFKQGALAEAQVEFETLAKANPAGLLEQTRFMIAECLFEAKKYELALPAYVDHLAAIEQSATAGEPIKQLARLHASQSANKMKQWEQGLQLAQGFIEKYSESAAVPDAWFEVGEAHRGATRPDQAIEAYETAASRGAPRLAARSRCMVGEIHFSGERYDEAVKQFRRVMFGYDETAAADVKMWQAFAGYEAGRCAQVQIASSQGADKQRHTDQAIEAFKYVVERHPQDRLAGEARKQLDKLTRPSP